MWALGDNPSLLLSPGSTGVSRLGTHKLALGMVLDQLLKHDSSPGDSAMPSALAQDATQGLIKPHVPSFLDRPSDSQGSPHCQPLLTTGACQARCRGSGPAPWALCPLRPSQEVWAHTRPRLFFLDTPRSEYHVPKTEKSIVLYVKKLSCIRTLSLLKGLWN